MRTWLLASLLVAAPAAAAQGPPQDTAAARPREAADARGTAPVPVPDTEPGRAVERFLDAYNTGDFAVLERFIAANPGFRTSGPARFVQVFREYGPVDPVWVASSDSLRITVWTRGRRTRAALGLVLQVQSARRAAIDWLGIDRRAIAPAEIRLRPIDDEAALVTEIRRWAEANRPGGFSGVVAVARAGRPIVRIAVGERDPGGTQITTDDAFLLASVSKVLVGLAAARLVADGRLTWDAPIAGRIPELPADRVRGMTLAHLLGHRSGLEFDDDTLFRRDMERARSISDMVRAQAAALDRLPSDTVLGPLDAFDYSNEGYVVAARLVEIASGVPYADFLRDSVAAELGLATTGLYRPDSPPDAFARPWTGRRWVDGFAVPGPLRLALTDGLGTPAGGVVSTADDLIRLGHVILQRSWLPAATWEEVLANGFGIDTVRDESEETILLGHSGNDFGVSAQLWVFPRTGYEVAVLSNREWVASAVASYLNEIVPR